MGWISLSERKPDEKHLVVFRAFDVDIGRGKAYTTDPYCGWMSSDGEFVRWPHNAMPPTHWMELPPAPQTRGQ